MAEEPVKMKKSDIVNLTGGVNTEDGRTLYGFDAEQYLKMKSKEDPELERKVGEWIEDLLGEKIEDPSDLYKSLKDGIILVKMANKILPGIIVRYSMPGKNGKLHVLGERENINLYLEACWKLGVDASDIFVTADLHGRRAMNAVISNIVALSRIAPQYGISEPKPLGPAIQGKKNNAPPKWKLEYQGPIHVGEIEFEGDTPEETISKLKKELENALIQIDTLNYSNDALKNDMKSIREKLRLARTEFIFDAPTDSETSVTDNPTTTFIDPNLDSRLSTLESQLNEERNKSKQMMKKMEEEIDKSTSTIESLREEIKKEKASFTVANNKISDLTRILRKVSVKSDSEQPLSILQLEKRANEGPGTPTRTPRGGKHKHDVQKRVWIYEKISQAIKSIMTCTDENQLIPSNELKEQAFNTDAGRRIFAYLLNQYVVGKGNQEVPIAEPAFNVLVDLVNHVLEQMKQDNGADFISAKYIINVSNYIVTRTNENNVYLYEKLEDCLTWQNATFWEEYFWDRVASKVPQSSFTEGITPEQKDYIKKQILSCARAMHTWGKIIREDIEIFVNSVSENLSLTKSETEELLDSLKSLYETTRVRRNSFVMMPQSRTEFVKQIRRVRSTRFPPSPTSSQSTTPSGSKSNLFVNTSLGLKLKLSRSDGTKDSPRKPDNKPAIPEESSQENTAQILAQNTDENTAEKQNEEVQSNNNEPQKAEEVKDSENTKPDQSHTEVTAKTEANVNEGTKESLQKENVTSTNEVLPSTPKKEDLSDEESEDEAREVMLLSISSGESDSEDDFNIALKDEQKTETANLKSSTDNVNQLPEQKSGPEIPLLGIKVNSPEETESLLNAGNEDSNVDLLLKMVEEKNQLLQKIEEQKLKLDSYLTEDSKYKELCTKYEKEVKKYEEQNEILLESQQKLDRQQQLLQQQSSKLQEYENARIRYEMQINGLKEQIANQEKASKALQDKVIADRKENLKLAQNEKKFQTDREEFQRKLEGRDGTIKLLKIKVEEKEKEIRNLGNSHAQLLKKKEATIKQQEDLILQMKKEDEQSETNKQDTSELESIISEKESKISEMEDQLEEKNTIIEANEEELQNQEDQIESLNAELEKLKEKHEEELQKLREELIDEVVDEDEKELENLRALIEKNAEDLRISTEQNEQLQKQVIELKTALEKSNPAKENKPEIIEKVEVVESPVVKLHDMFKIMKDDASAPSPDLDEIAKGLKEEEIIKVKEYVDKILQHKQVNQLGRSTRRRGKRRSSMQEAKPDAEEDVDEELEKLKTQIKTLTDKNNELSQKIKEVENTKEDRTTTRKRRESENSEVRQLLKQIEQLKKESDILRTQITSRGNNNNLTKIIGSIVVVFALGAGIFYFVNPNKTLL